MNKETIAIAIKAMLNTITPSHVDVQVRAMQLGKEMFESKNYRQTTLDEYMDVDLPEPKGATQWTIVYTVNPAYFTEKRIEELFIYIIKDCVMNIEKIDE